MDVGGLGGHPPFEISERTAEVGDREIGGKALDGDHYGAQRNGPSDQRTQEQKK